MQRVTITLDDDLMTELDQLIAARGYRSRSEAVRDLSRAGIAQALLEGETAPDCVAALVFVYDMRARDVAGRLTATFHDHHDLAVSTLHMPLDHGSGLQVAMLKGATAHVRQLAETICAERGVRHGRLMMIPASFDHNEHVHLDGDGQTHTHIHAR